MSERAKRGLLSFLLLLMLVLLALAAINSFQAVQTFQQEDRALKAGDVSTIHPWMTIHVISHVYHIPEAYLYCSLHISNPSPYRHATLSKIATQKRQPVEQVIHIVQHAILTYRNKGSSHCLTPGSPHAQTRPLSATPGRA